MASRTGRLILAIMLVAALWAGRAQDASSWTLLRNNYPNNPVGCNNADYPCIKWPVVGGLSVTVYVYVDPAVGTTRTQDAVTAISRWNAVAARNPHLVRTTSLSSATGSAYGWPTEVAWVDGLPNDVYAATMESTLHEIYGEGYDDNVIKTFEIDLNSSISWNHNLDYSVNLGVYHADSRAVILHEFGHGEGLGHTSHTAIMNTNMHSIYTVQSDDSAGIVAAYGAY